MHARRGRAAGWRSAVRRQFSPRSKSRASAPPALSRRNALLAPLPYLVPLSRHRVRAPGQRRSDPARGPFLHPENCRRNRGTRRKAANGLVMVAFGLLGRYFGRRFLMAVLVAFLTCVALIAVVDFFELTRRIGDRPGQLGRADRLSRASAAACLHRTDAAVLPSLIGAMSAFLALSRRLEFIVARASGLSAWQFIGSAIAIAALIGAFSTTIYNPVSAALKEVADQIENELAVAGCRRRRARALSRQYLGAPAQRCRPGDHQRADLEQPGPHADRRADLRVRHQGRVRRAGRSEIGRSRTRRLAAHRCLDFLAQSEPESAERTQTADHAHRGSGSRQFRECGSAVVLGVACCDRRREGRRLVRHALRNPVPDAAWPARCSWSRWLYWRPPSASACFASVASAR